MENADKIVAFIKPLIIGAGALLPWISRLTHWRSWRFAVALTLGAIILMLQIVAEFTGNIALLLAAGAIAVAFAVLFFCLLFFRPKTVLPWTFAQQGGVVLVAVFILLFAYMSGRDKAYRSRFSITQSERQAFMEYHPLPPEILGLRLSPPEGSKGMSLKREQRSLGHGGQVADVAWWVDESPRQVEGPNFVSVTRKCSFKTFSPLKVVADTAVMAGSDESIVMEKARAIADEIQHVCAIRMKHPSLSSIRSRSSDSVSLYFGNHEGMLADVSWIRTEKGKGVLRMLLVAGGAEQPTSPLFLEAAQED